MRLFVRQGFAGKQFHLRDDVLSLEPLNKELLQDNIRLRRGDFRATAEVNENEPPKLGYVLSGHTYKEIVPSGDKEDVPHLSHSCQTFSEGMNDIAGVHLQADGNDRLEGMPHRLGVDVGIEASDHTARDQCPHPAQTG